MLQIDPLLSYSFSASLAIAARRDLLKKKNLCLNKYFLFTLLWLSLTFAPQVLYLCRRFPAWESMFAVRDHDEYPPWLEAATAAGIIVSGSLGFYITALQLRRGKQRAAKAQVAWSLAASLFLVTYGWDGTGLKRLSYAGTGEEWANGVAYAYTDFLFSPVARTLIWLETFVMVPYAILMRRWARVGSGETEE
ncbi:MAG: hypothetical protein ACYC99_16585 [Candidatus Geothermincolia bacterium]